MVALVSQENVIALVSRTGRHLQRYNEGRRQVVGCIPYRYKFNNCNSLGIEDMLEVLVISSVQKGKGMMFPKGGWELDETKIQAASRETLEEAGVRGIVECELGEWTFKNNHDTMYEGYMFPLLVKEELDFWPEKTVRQRKWVSVAKARECCRHGWMKEALEVLVKRLASRRQLEEEEVSFDPLATRANLSCKYQNV